MPQAPEDCASDWLCRRWLLSKLNLWAVAFDTIHDACSSCSCSLLSVQGMQRNPGMKTIEAELESSLCRAGAIAPQDSGSFTKVTP
jgi:hypothetical protein